MKIRLIGAMEEETAYSSVSLQQESEQVVAGYTFYQGQLSARTCPVQSDWQGQCRYDGDLLLFDVDPVTTPGAPAL